MRSSKQASQGAKKKSASATKKAPAGRKGKAGEADLYRIQGNILFYLHTYRGLTVFDISNLKMPHKLASLPVFGFPLEMFVENGIATILVRQAMDLIKEDGKFFFKPLTRSQLITVDIRTPSAPKILQRFDIFGDLREGVSRKIGHTLYLVSYKRQWRWGYRRTQRKELPGAVVYSFDLSNPRKIKLIQKIGLSEGYKPKKNPNRKNERHTLSGVTVSATANTLLVAENRSYDWNWSRRHRSWFSEYEHYSYTRLNIVDISDPKGKIRIHARLIVRGRLGDQFKQTYTYDTNTKKALYLGIFARFEWKSELFGWRKSNLTKNTLLSVDVTDGAKPKILDSLIFGKPRETVSSTSSLGEKVRTQSSILLLFLWAKHIFCVLTKGSFS